MMIAIRRRAERGQVLLMFALASVALFGIAALAIDGGRILIDQRTLQNAADGAALTGAADIGPTVPKSASETAIDDAVYAIEQSLGIDFSNNYTCPGPAWCNGGQTGVVAHVLQGGACRPTACDGATTPGGPYNKSDNAAAPAATAPCCVNWVDTTGNYTLNITTPYAYPGAEDSAFIHVDLVHKLPLLVGGALVPTVNVHVQATGRNYALNYSIFAFKHDDSSAINHNGSGGLSTNKSVGSNGGVAGVGSGTLTFTCVGSPSQFGGDVDTWIPATISFSGVGSNKCPGPTPASVNNSLANYKLVPNVHLPDDPCLAVPAPASPNCGALAGPITVSGTQMLQPTRSSVSGQPIGPRYSLVTVPAGATLYLQPGVYYFEGTGATSDAMGLQIGGSVVTGDCYGQAPPSCNAAYQYNNAAGICQPATQLALAISGVLQRFNCTPQGDFGVLLVFWSAGPASDPACTGGTSTRGATTYKYCTDTTSGTAHSGDANRLHIQGGATFYAPGSPMYHSVVVYDDPKHATSSWNFTDTATLSSATGCTTTKCASQIGNGSSIWIVQGGANVSILGATLAPEGWVFIGGASSGAGFGQLLAYGIHWQGSGSITENFNPLALAYSPVLVQ